MDGGEGRDDGQSAQGPVGRRRTLPFALSVVGATEGSEPRGTLWGFRCSQAPSGSCRGNRLGCEGGEPERRGEAVGLDQGGDQGVRTE